MTRECCLISVFFPEENWPVFLSCVQRREDSDISHTFNTIINLEDGVCIPYRDGSEPPLST